MTNRQQQWVLQWPVDGALKMCHSVAIITVKRSLFKTLKRAEGAAKKGSICRSGHRCCSRLLHTTCFGCSSWSSGCSFSSSSLCFSGSSCSFLDVLLIAVICNFKQRMINFSTRKVKTENACTESVCVWECV